MQHNVLPDPSSSVIAPSDFVGDDFDDQLTSCSHSGDACHPRPTCDATADSAAESWKVYLNCPIFCKKHQVCQRAEDLASLKQFLQDHREAADEVVEGSSGFRPIHCAAKSGNCAVIDLILSVVPDCIERRYSTGGTPIYVASFDGHLDAVRLLYHQWPEGIYETTFIHRSTCIAKAAVNGHSDVLAFLLEKWEEGASVYNAHWPTVFQAAPTIFLAAQHGHLECVKLLVGVWLEGCQHGNDRGEMPLFIAAKNGHLEVVECLYDAWPDGIKARCISKKTPLFAATESGQTKVVEFLLGKWPQALYLKTADHRTPLSVAQEKHDSTLVPLFEQRLSELRAIATEPELERPEVMMQQYDSTVVPCVTIHDAAKFGNCPMIKEMLQVDAAVAQERSGNGDTPIYLACLYGHVEAVKMLYQAWPAGLKESVREGKYTTAHAASKSDDVATLQFVLEHWPDGIRAESEYHTTPIRIALDFDCGSTFAFLLSKQPDYATSLNPAGLPLVYGAVQSHGAPILKPIIEQLRTMPMDLNGRTVLHNAVSFGNLVAVECLVDAWPALVRQADRSGYHPIHYAALFKRRKIYEWLKKQNPDSVHWCSEIQSTEDVDTLRPTETGVKTGAKMGPTAIFIARFHQLEEDQDEGDSSQRSPVKQIVQQPTQSEYAWLSAPSFINTGMDMERSTERSTDDHLTLTREDS